MGAYVSDFEDGDFLNKIEKRKEITLRSQLLKFGGIYQFYNERVKCNVSYIPYSIYQSPSKFVIKNR